MNDTPELALCIPGPWRDRSELLQSIAASGMGYGYAADRLFDEESGFTCELLFQDGDPVLTEAFAAAGPHWAASGAMAALAGHASVAYLLGPGGSRAAAEAMMRAGAVLVEAGGLGVKVESTGIAHGPAYWMALCDALDELSAHRALVVYVAGAEVRSCGMHNFGLPEAATSGADQAGAADMLRTFTRYLLERAPVLEDGHTFSVSDGMPVYRLSKVPARDYGPDSLFNNPYGAWRLEPVVPEAALKPAPEKKSGWWNRIRH